MSQTIHVEELYRETFGQLAASLVSYFGLPNIGQAEDIVQEAFVAAMQTWPKQMPDDPKAWLFRVCKNKALNTMKKGKTEMAQRSFFETGRIAPTYQLDQLFLDHEVKDNQLRLLFALCHPGLAEKSQVMLILRMLMGFRTEEIASGLGMGLEAVKKALSRAKSKIKAAQWPLKVPFAMASAKRLDSVHKAIYLIFNEGYSSTSGNELIRQALCMQAIRLAKSLMALSATHNHDTFALLALMLFNAARFPARQHTHGTLVDLANQDRSLWDQTLIQYAYQWLNKSRGGSHLSTYHLEAGIAAAHCAAPTFRDTDWAYILRLYQQLFTVNPSPFVWLNQQVALSYAIGPLPAIRAIEGYTIPDVLSNYAPYYITLGKLYQRAGAHSKARGFFKKGLSFAKALPQKSYIQQLIDQE